MNSLNSNIQDAENSFSMHHVSEDQITVAEAMLNLSFSTEYKSYLLEFGIASFKSYELTGICNSPRLNVVNVTKNARIHYPDLPGSLYVVVELHIDNILICQDKTGNVYEVYGTTINQIAPCLNAFFFQIS